LNPQLPELLKKHGKWWASKKKACELTGLTSIGLYAAKDIPRTRLLPPGFIRQCVYFRADKLEGRTDPRKTQWCPVTDSFGTWFPVPLAAPLAGEDSTNLARYAWALEKGRIHKVPRRLRECKFDLKRSQASYGHDDVWHIRGDSLNSLCRSKDLPEPWQCKGRSNRHPEKRGRGRPPDPKVATSAVVG
jgi:hypothetical protein